MKRSVPHVVMISAECAPWLSLGGLGVAVSRLAAQLAAVGVRCTVITSQAERSAPARAELAGGGQWQTVPVPPGPSANGTAALRAWWWAFALAAVDAVRALPAAPDLVVLHDNDTTLFPRAAAQAGAHWRMLYWLHSLYDRPAESGGSLIAEAIHGSSLLALSGHVLNDARRLRWPARLHEVQRAIRLRSAQERVLTVESPGCVAVTAAPSEPRAAANDARRVVLFAGRADYAKGLGFVLEAARSEAARRIRFIITGEAPAGTIHPSNVEWLGWLPAERAAAEMRTAHCVFAPSVAEGFGLSAAEAMAAGARVVALPVGGLQALEGNPRFAGVNLSDTERELLYELWAALLVEGSERRRVWESYRPHVAPLTDKLVAALVSATQDSSPNEGMTPAANPPGSPSWGEALAAFLLAGRGSSGRTR